MKTVGCTEYIDLMNEIVKKYDGYNKGMKVINVPVDSKYPTGYTAKADNLTDEITLKGLMSMAKVELEKRYILDVNLP